MKETIQNPQSIVITSPNNLFLQEAIIIKGAVLG